MVADIAFSTVTRILNQIMFKGRKQSDWIKSLMTPLYKKKRLRYELCLLQGAYSTVIFLNHVRESSKTGTKDSKSDDTQVCFQTGKGLSDAAFNLRMWRKS